MIEIGVIIAIYLFTVYFAKEKLSIIAPIIFTFTVYIFSFEQGLISSFLKAKPIQLLGKWSYSIYMVHALLILIIGRSVNLFENLSGEVLYIKHVTEVVDTELVFWNNSYVMDFFTVCFLAVLIFISSLTYKYVELKMSNFDFFKFLRKKPVK